jgi:3-dehydroquinate synthase
VPIRSRSTLDLGGVTTRIRFVDSISGAVNGEQALFVCDEHTVRYVPHGGETVVLSSGEANKSWDSVSLILEKALERRLGRDDRFVGVGGGVVCDTAAFAASVYMRGARLTLAPTTLLAMVDAALGGKTGIDFHDAKNLVGTFYPAEEVQICLATLCTLSGREYLSGIAEGLKHAFLGEESLYSMFRNERTAVLAREPRCLERIVAGSIEVKGSIVEADPKEGGIRAHLNLGHTFAHALESVTGFCTYTHGEAVAWGIGRASRLGVALGITDRRYAASVIALLADYGYPVSGVRFDADRFLEYMKADKKRKAGEIRFVVQERFGVTRTVTADESAVRSVLFDDSAVE